MKLNELLDVLADGTKICLYDSGFPLRFDMKQFQKLDDDDDCDPDYTCIDEVRGLRCDEMTVDCVEHCGEALFVYVNPDWMR